MWGGKAMETDEDSATKGEKAEMKDHTFFKEDKRNKTLTKVHTTNL